MDLNVPPAPLPLGSCSRGLAGRAGATGSAAYLGPPRSASPERVQDAFEALLVGELLKPLEDSLRESGFVPKGAPGDMYAHFWKSHLSDLLARSMELLPPMVPEAGAEASSGSRGQTALNLDVALSNGSATPAADASTKFWGLPLGRARSDPSRSGLALGHADPAVPIRKIGPEDHFLGVGTRGMQPIKAMQNRVAARRGASPVQIPDHLELHIDRLRPHEGIIRGAAKETGLSANWLRAVISQESGGRAEAISRKGAQGLMQLMPATATSLGVADSLNPKQNVRAGARYLSALMRRFEDPRLALAAYNAGPSRVEAYAGIPPYPETRSYIQKVLTFKEAYDRLWPQDSGPSRADE